MFLLEKSHEERDHFQLLLLLLGLLLLLRLLLSLLRLLLRLLLSLLRLLLLLLGLLLLLLWLPPMLFLLWLPMKKEWLGFSRLASLRCRQKSGRVHGAS